MDDLIENLTEDEETDGPDTEQKKQERSLIRMQTRIRINDYKNITSQMTRLVLSLPYMELSARKAFKFSLEGYEAYLEARKEY